MTNSLNEESRFSVKGKSKIENKYVLYVEDLHVSFYGYSRKKDLSKKIKEKEKILKKIGKQMDEESLTKLINEINLLKDSLEYKEEKTNLENLNIKLKNSKGNNKKKIKSEIDEIKHLMESEKRNKKLVLKGITFGLKQGETLALVGANGAGKTVLLETILGFNIPEKCKKMVLNLGNQTYLSNLKEIGIQYQQSKIPKSLTTKKAIINQKKLYKNKVDESELNKMIDTFGIREFYNSKVNSLSGGQRQRLNLLLAVLHQPKLMILDEFITGLDVKSVRKIINYVNELKIKNNASMIIVSHQPEEIQELSDRIIVMKDGKMVKETNKELVLKEYSSMASFVEGVI